MKLRATLIAFMFVLAMHTAAAAHCGACGVGEAAAPESGEADKHMMKESICMCGMPVTSEMKTHHVEHAGKTFHFCSLKCAEKFKADPEAMAEKLKGSQKGSHKGSHKGS